MPQQTDGITLGFKAGEVQQMLNALSGVNMELVHADLGEEMVQIIQGRFMNGMDVDGVPFAPIKDYTYYFGNLSRDRKSTDKPLLVGLGAPPLKNSFEYEASADQVIVGTPVEHAKYHSDFPGNNGEPRHSLKLREFMGVTQDRDFARLIGVVEDHFMTLAEVQGNLV